MNFFPGARCQGNVVTVQGKWLALPEKSASRPKVAAAAIQPWALPVEFQPQDTSGCCRTTHQAGQSVNENRMHGNVIRSLGALGSILGLSQIWLHNRTIWQNWKWKLTVSLLVQDLWQLAWETQWGTASSGMYLGSAGKRGLLLAFGWAWKEGRILAVVLSSVPISPVLTLQQSTSAVRRVRPLHMEPEKIRSESLSQAGSRKLRRLSDIWDTSVSSGSAPRWESDLAWPHLIENLGLRYLYYG